MRDDFKRNAQDNGAECRFFFNGRPYVLKTIDDVKGRLLCFDLDSEELMPSHRNTLKIESGRFTAEMQCGISLSSLSERFTGGQGGKGHMYIFENKRGHAHSVWGAAFDILDGKYGPGRPCAVPVKNAPFLRVYEGGRA